MTWPSALAVLSGVSFLVFGFNCLRSPAMRREFERFGLARYRVLTGGLEMAGGVGVLAGLWSRPLLVLSACGLSLLMLFVVGARIRLRDSLWPTLPAVVMWVLNGHLAAEAFRRGAA